MILEYLLENFYEPNIAEGLVVVEVCCDRCHRNVTGTEYNSCYGYPVRAGFYLPESFWRRFFKRGERVICDGCMKEDPRFRKVFADRFPQKRRRRRRRRYNGKH